MRYSASDMAVMYQIFLRLRSGKVWRLNTFLNVLQVGQSAQHGLWSKEVLFKVFCILFFSKTYIGFLHVETSAEIVHFAALYMKETNLLYQLHGIPVSHDLSNPYWFYGMLFFCFSAFSHFRQT